MGFAALSPSYALTHGGGIFGANSVTIALINSTLSNNSALRSGTGGGGGMRTGIAILTDSTVSGNFATANGGGVYGVVRATLTGTTVSGNSAAGEGGGIWGSNLILTDSIVTGNTGGTVGGGVFPDSSATLINSSVLNNTATLAGGGVDAYRGAPRAVTLINSTVSGNTGTFEAAWLGGATVTLTNSTISGNTLTSGIGAGVVSTTTATLTNSTVSGNTTPGFVGGGVYSIRGDLTLTNSIIANNISTNQNPDCRTYVGTVAASHTLVETAGDCGVTAGTNGNLNGDPSLSALADNGCATPAGAPGSAACVQTQALASTSTAVDAGDQSVCVAPPVSGLDQREYPRVGTCDLGAYEFGAALQPQANLSAQLANTAIFGQSYVAGAPCSFPGECNAGVFSFMATFCNTNSTGGATLVGLTSRTRSLSAIASLVSRERDVSPVVGGAGSEQDFLNGTLVPQGCENITYEIGLSSRARFSFFVDVYGNVVQTPWVRAFPPVGTGFAAPSRTFVCPTGAIRGSGRTVPDGANAPSG